MKKIKFIFFTIVLLGILLVGINLFMGKAISDTELKEKYCPKPPFDIASNASQVIQTATGGNFLAEKIAESTVKKSISPFVKGNIKVKAKSFSVTDAKEGKFESFEVKGRNLLVADSVYISDFWAETVCGFVHFDLNSNPTKLKAPLLLDFDVKFSENDLNKIINSPDYNKFMLSVKINSNKINLFGLNNPKISLDEGKFKFSIDIQLPFVSAFSFTTISDLEIEDNKIKITNMQMGSTNNMIDISGLKHITNIFDPLYFAQKVFEQYNCNLFLKNVKIQNEKVIITGSIFIDKD